MRESRRMLPKLTACFVLSALIFCFPVNSQVQNCSNPQDVTLTGLQTTANSATLQWTLPATFPVSCVQQYAVCWFVTAQGSPSTCRTLPPAATLLAADGLQPCTAYTFRVTVKSTTGAHTTVNFAGSTGASAVSNFSVSWLSATSLTVSWEYNPQWLNCILHFVAVVCNETNQEMTLCRRYPVVLSGGSYAVNVIDLQPCRTYYVRVATQPTLAGSAALHSAEVPFYLDGVSVSWFNATAVGNSTMTVSWATPEPADASCEHELTACAVPLSEGRTRCSANLTSPASQANITNLRSCTAYQLRLDLTTPTGVISTLGPIQPTFSTDRRLVTSLRLSRARDTILAQWVPVHADPACGKGYRVCWNETDGRVCEDTNSTTTSFTIVDLDSGGYAVEVAGIFFDDSFSASVVQTSRISGAASKIFSPIVLMFAIVCGKTLQTTQ